MAQPLISVVIPAYNTRHTIAESLDSILAQSYHHYEIIVVDDGSPDDVAAFVDKNYRQKVRLIRQANTGLAGARNTGIQHARGSYVAFLDSDDVWLPDKLLQQVAHIAAHPDGTVFYASCYFWEDGKRTGVWTDTHQQADGQIAQALISRQVMLPVLTAVVRTAALKQIGLFDASLRQVEDYDLWLRLAAAGESFYGLPQPLALYRVNPLGLSRNTLLMARTQLSVYQKLLAAAGEPLRPLIRRQITTFQLEVLHQQRQLTIKRRQRLASARLTCAMIPYRPGKTLSYLATAAILLVEPSVLATKLA